MMERGKTVHVRLPKVLLDALVHEVGKGNETMSSFLRRVFSDAVDRVVDDEVCKKDEVVAVTFTAPLGFNERASQAALRNGTSVTAFYVQSLSDELGVLPCRVVAEVEQEESKE